ncbi:MAG: 2'-5' RNA ligase family protein [Anaerolineales bacterium]
MKGRRSTSAIEAALVVVVPEAEPLVRDYRREYDPSAAKGMPAHITINYPFLPGADPSEATLQGLRSLLSGVAPFPFRLTRWALFPDLLYLAPEPEEPFRNLVIQVQNTFPDSLPYGGEHSEIIPHLTIAQEDDPVILEGISSDFQVGAESRLPIWSQASHVWLMDNRKGRWSKQTSFRLGG